MAIPVDVNALPALRPGEEQQTLQRDYPRTAEQAEVVPLLRARGVAIGSR